MSKKNPRRTVRVKQTIRYGELSSDSEDSDHDMGWLELFTMAFQHSKPRRSRSSGRSSKRKTSPRKTHRTPRRISIAGSNTARARHVTVTNTTTVPLLSSVNNVSITTSINLDDSVIADQSKKVEDKVESFFKTHNLISDDEDDNPTKKVTYPSKDTKAFYELSDSDDDIKLNSFISQPSTSYVAKEKSSISNINRANKFNDKLKCQNELIDLVEISPPSKDDELMDIVDKILVDTEKPIDITTEKDQSWSDYKNKAEEILGNISNLLDDISKDAKSKTVEQEDPKEESPKSAKPICPICLEMLGGDILAMTTTCGHIFCKTCIEKVAKTVKKCPTCRKAVNQKKIHPIYL